MTSISDPSRPSRRDRRRAQKLIDTAYAEGRLTSADRTLRTQRIDAAHTQGDLAMITRDLLTPVQANLGRALDPGSSASTARRLGVPATLKPGTPTIDLSGIGRKVRLFVLLAVGGLLLSCALGLAAFIPAVISSFDGDSADAPSGIPSAVPTGITSSAAEGENPDNPPAAGLHTAAGWTQLVDAIEAESGTTEVYDLVAYPTYASVGMVPRKRESPASGRYPQPPGEGAVERRFYRDGDWQDSVSVRTPAAGTPVNLADIDADTIARLPAETARHFEIGEPTGTYLVINAFAGDARIVVYVQSDGGSDYRVYRLDGTPMS